LLGEDQLKQVTDKGLVVSKEDMTAAGLGEFRAMNEGILGMRKAPYEQVVGAYKKASDQATKSSGIANQWAEIEQIAKRSRKEKTGVSWLDTYNQLPQAERAKLSAAANIQIQSATGSANESGTSAGRSGGNQDTKSKTKGAEFTGGVVGKAPPAGSGGARGAVVPNLTGSINESNSGSKSQQEGATTGATTGASSSASSGVNQQASFRNIVDSIFQGKKILVFKIKLKRH